MPDSPPPPSPSLSQIALWMAAQPRLSSHSRFQGAQRELRCPPGHPLLPSPSGLSAQMPGLLPLPAAGLLLILHFRLPPLEAISNPALAPCRDERDKGGTRQSQIRRVKRCSFSQQNIFKFSHSPRTNAKTRAWPSRTCCDLWMVYVPPFESLPMHKFCRFQWPKLVPLRPDKFR